MLDGLLLTAGVYAAALACWAAYRAVRGRAPTRTQAMVALVLQAGLVVHGVARLATLAGSARPHDLPVGVGYLIAGALMLPLVAGALSGALLDAAATPTASGWDSAALALAAAATVVVALRIHATWP